MPLPFQTFGGVSSMEFDVVPHVWLLDVLLIAALLLPLARRLARTAGDAGGPPSAPLVAGGIGLVLCAAAAAFIAAGFAQRTYRPVWSLGGADYGNDASYRPVGIAWGGATTADCKPSTFWFPDGWHGKVTRRR